MARHSPCVRPSLGGLLTQLLLSLAGFGHSPATATASELPPLDTKSLEYVVNQARADAVKQTFQIAWDGYYKYAFPHDSLLPVTNGFEDDRNGWGASAIDAFSTALVMEKWDVVNQILDFVPTIDFNYTNSSVSLFETTIRYLGGLLSAYDLMTGPLANMPPSEGSVEDVLKQAQRLADNLKVAFDTPSGIPDNTLFFGPPRPNGSAITHLATAGTLVLEWTRLSDLTGEPRYGLMAQQAEKYLLSPGPLPLAEPFPGLLGTTIDLATGKFVDGAGSWGAGDDSYYEYLIKMYLYDPVRFAAYKDSWVKAADSSIRYLASHPSSRPELTFLAAWKNTTLSFVSQHLTCFSGGNFILGGLTLQNARYVRFGLALVDSCYATYTATATGIGPEVFAWQDDRSAPTARNNRPAPARQSGFYAQAGFWISDSQYVLRPEVLESIYYAYRATGDTKYQHWAWDAFLAINRTCAVGSGYSSINNVNSPSGGGFQNFQESFWFAEVLKYAYLIHAEEAPWQIRANRTNEFVYNTECHPIRIASGLERAGLDNEER